MNHPTGPVYSYEDNEPSRFSVFGKQRKAGDFAARLQPMSLSPGLDIPGTGGKGDPSGRGFEEAQGIFGNMGQQVQDTVMAMGMQGAQQEQELRQQEEMLKVQKGRRAQGQGGFGGIANAAIDVLGGVLGGGSGGGTRLAGDVFGARAFSSDFDAGSATRLAFGFRG